MKQNVIPSTKHKSRSTVFQRYLFNVITVYQILIYKFVYIAYLHIQIIYV